MLKSKIDFFFSYKNVFRFLLINLWGSLLNNNNLPSLEKIFFSFKVYNLIDFDEVRSFIIVIFSDFFLELSHILLKMYQISFGSILL